MKPNWAKARPLLIAGLALAFVLFFFFWRLGTMTAGLGPREYTARQNSQEVEQIINRGINAPYYLLQHASTELPSSNIFGLRLTSVLVGLTIFIFLFMLLRSWFGQTIAFFAVLIFVTTPWVLISARTATPNIMLLWLIVPLACFILVGRSKEHPGLWWLLLCLSAAIALYTPGLFWFLLAAVIVSSRAFLNYTKRVNTALIVAGMAAAILLVVPLIVALSLEPTRIRSLLLIPSAWQPGLDVAKSLGWGVSSVFWQTENHIDIGINRLPLLNILQIVLVIFGFYALSSRARNINLSLIGLLLFAIIISALNKDSHLLLLGLPAVAVFLAAGLRFLYIEWRKIFPLNPFAYGLAIGLISLVVGAHLLYAARYSLIAWPHTSETKSAYVLK